MVLGRNKFPFLWLCLQPADFTLVASLDNLRFKLGSYYNLFSDVNHLKIPIITSPFEIYADRGEHTRTHERTDAWMHGRLDARTHGRTDARTRRTGARAHERTHAQNTLIIIISITTRRATQFPICNRYYFTLSVGADSHRVHDRRQPADLLPGAHAARSGRHQHQHERPGGAGRCRLNNMADVAYVTGPRFEGARAADNKNHLVFYLSTF